MQDLSSLKFTVPLETREMRKAKMAHSSFIHFLSSKPIAAALKANILGQVVFVNGIDQKNHKAPWKSSDVRVLFVLATSLPTKKCVAQNFFLMNLCWIASRGTGHLRGIRQARPPEAVACPLLEEVLHPA